MTKRKTFKVDNQIIEWGPNIFDLQKRPAEQLFLPGLDNRKPLPPFAEWVVYGLYALLDPMNPTATIRTTPTELLEVLEFARDVSAALGDKETYSSDQYKLINESLDLLYTVEIHQAGFWKNYTVPGDKRKKKKDGKRYPFAFRGRILSNYTLIYPPDVDPPEFLPEDQVENISRSKFTDWKVLKRKEGPRPIGIELTLDPRLVNGLTGKDPNIGTTTLPYKIFEIRKSFPKNQTLKRLLLYVLRQANQTMKNQDLDKLAKRLELDTRRQSKTRSDLQRGFEILQSSGVVESFHITPEDTSGKVKFTFTKSKDWYLDNDSDQEEPGDNAGEEEKKAES
ncbi:MAG: hypothetical protein BWX67_02226 [Thermotogae bacterium ADurb.Bin062]|nr:MAG: hypothetical protein BWX67_02226 [Thermotogota bacterium ADurb.Bin062]